MKLVFDTSVLIQALRLHQGAVKLFETLDASEETLCIPSIVGFELFSGQSSKDSLAQKQLKALMDYFEIIDLDWRIAKRAGEIYRSGLHTLEVPDYIVAASALEAGGEVVTLNKKHFELIPGLALYSFHM